MDKAIDAPRKGTIPFVFLRISSFALIAGSSVLIGRLLGPTSFGIYASASAVLATVLILGCLGIDQLYLQRGIDDLELRVRIGQMACLTIIVAIVVALMWSGLNTTARLCLLPLAVASAFEQLRLPYLLEPQRQLDFIRRGLREVQGRCLILVVLLPVVALRPTALAASIGLAGGAAVACTASVARSPSAIPLVAPGSDCPYSKGYSLRCISCLVFRLFPDRHDALSRYATPCRSGPIPSVLQCCPCRHDHTCGPQ